MILFFQFLYIFRFFLTKVQTKYPECALNVISEVCCGPPPADVYAVIVWAPFFCSNILHYGCAVMASGTNLNDKFCYFCPLPSFSPFAFLFFFAVLPAPAPPRLWRFVFLLQSCRVSMRRPHQLNVCLPTASDCMCDAFYNHKK